MILVSEIFGPTLQGEGPHVGEQTLFLRTGGCDFRCSWCDSLHAVDQSFSAEWARMEADQILISLRALWPSKPACSLTLTGGNPAIWEQLKSVINGWPGPIRLETQGSIIPGWLGLVDTIIVSPKPPSSGQNADGLPLFMAAIPARCEVAMKVACASQKDLDWAIETHAPYADRVPLLFVQPVNDVAAELSRDELINRWSVLWSWLEPYRLAHVRPSHQQHVLVWGNRRGV